MRRPKDGRGVLTAEHPDGGTLYAAFDPSARFIVPGVRDSRFGARLAPYPDEASARAALKREGAGLREAVR